MKALDLFVRQLTAEGSVPAYAVMRPYKAWTINQEAQVESHGGYQIRVPLISTSEGNPEGYAWKLIEVAAGPLRHVDTLEEAEWTAQAWIPDQVKSIRGGNGVVLVVPERQTLGYYVVQYQFWGLILVAPIFAFCVGNPDTRFTRPEVV